MTRKFTPILFFLLAGCAGPGGMFGPGTFSVEEADGRFTDSDTRVLFGTNNRISSKSVAGGVHIDGNGMYVNPLVAISDADIIEYVGFSLENVSSYSTRTGSPNSLGYLEEVVFLVGDDDRISKSVGRQRFDWSDQIDYNSITQSASSGILESGSIAVNPQEFGRIANAETLAVRITGSRRSVTYEQEDISKSFLENLRTFYDAHIKGKDSVL